MLEEALFVPDSDTMINNLASRQLKQYSYDLFDQHYTR